MKMNNEKSFLLYTAYAEQLDEMTDAQAGQLFRAILEYESDGKPVISDPMVKLAFSFIASQLRRDDEKWEETRKLSQMKRAKRSRKLWKIKARPSRYLISSTTFSPVQQNPTPKNKFRQKPTPKNRTRQKPTKLSPVQQSQLLM